MTEWLLRRKRGRALGPVPTRALVRGIMQGKVPPDTEAREVAGGEWMPLAAYDEFYEALGLGDDATRVVQTPWFLSGEDAGAGDSLRDADEDEEATRVMDALADLGSGSGPLPVGSMPPAPRPAAGIPAARPSAWSDSPPQGRELAPRDHGPGMVAGLPPPAFPGGHGYGGATQPADVPLLETPPPPIAGGHPDEHAIGDADDDAVTRVMESPSAEQCELWDADEEFDSASTSRPGVPLPAAGRPAPLPAAGRSASLKPSHAAAPTSANRRPGAARPPTRRGRFWGADSGYESADERTAPAARFVRQIHRTQTFVFGLSAALLAAVIAIVWLLLQ